LGFFGDGGSKHAKFEAGDKQKVRAYFAQHKPKVTRIDRDRVNVSIGVGIPTGIELYPLPGIMVGDCPVVGMLSFGRKAGSV
jgi:hypothetical protein